MISGFIAKNKLKYKLTELVGHPHPIEDAINYNSLGILAVADGVTRDPSLTLPTGPTFLPKSGPLGKIRKLISLYQFNKNYPRPSPAAAASKVFVESFLSTMLSIEQEDINSQEIGLAFKIANEKIKKLNSHILETNYLTSDYAGCVASAACVTNEFFHYGFICDCGVCVVDKNGNVKFKTDDEGPSKHDEKIWEEIRKKLHNDAVWENPKARSMVRREYRNNPQNKNSFGVLTGEETALPYIKSGSVRRAETDSLMVYTDGFNEIAFREDQNISGPTHWKLKDEYAEKISKKDTKGLEDICNRDVSTEGSLVYYFPSGDDNINGEFKW